MPYNLYSTKHFDAYLRGLGFIEGSDEPIKLRVGWPSITMNRKPYSLLDAILADESDNARKLIEFAKLREAENVTQIVDESNRFAEYLRNAPKSQLVHSIRVEDEELKNKINEHIKSVAQQCLYSYPSPLALDKRVVNLTKKNYEDLNILLDYPEIVKGISELEEKLQDLIASVDERIIYKMIDIGVIGKESIYLMTMLNISSDILRYFIEKTKPFDAIEIDVIGFLNFVAGVAIESKNYIALQIILTNEQFQKHLEISVDQHYEDFHKHLLGSDEEKYSDSDYPKALLRHAPPVMLNAILERVIQDIQDVDNGSLIEVAPLQATLIYLYLRDPYKHQDFVDMTYVTGEDYENYNADTKLLINLHKSLQSDADDFELISKHLDESLQMILTIIKYSETDDLGKYIHKLEYIIDNLKPNVFVNLAAYALDDSNLLKAINMLKPETYEKWISFIDESNCISLAKSGLMLLNEDFWYRYLTDNPAPRLGLECIDQTLDHLSTIELNDFQDTDLNVLEGINKLMGHFNIVLVEPEELDKALMDKCNDKLGALRNKINDRIQDPTTSAADKEKYLNIDEVLKPSHVKHGMKY
jgi:hypothetical protein